MTRKLQWRPKRELLEKRDLLEKFVKLSKAVKEVDEGATWDWEAAKRGTENATSLVRDCADTLYEEGVAEELGAEAADLLLTLGARQADERRTKQAFLKVGEFRRACSTIGALVESATIVRKLVAANSVRNVGQKVNEYLFGGNEEQIYNIVD